MENISYHRATVNDTSVLVENRILFAIELNGKQNPEVIQALREQMTAYFSKATADNSCISFIAECDDGLKAYLEHNIKLNLIADKFPSAISDHGK